MALEALADAAAADPDPLRAAALALGGARRGPERAFEAKSTFLRAAELAKSAALPDLQARAAAWYGGRLLWARALTDERLVPMLEDALSALDEEDDLLRPAPWPPARAAALRSDPSREPRARVREEALRAARRSGTALA